MMGLNEWFSLKERKSFTIDPKIQPEDSKFYFGREEIRKKLLTQIKRSFIDPGIPKMVVFGPYGSGKTQTLFHLKYYLQKTPPEWCYQKPRLIHFDLEMSSKSDHKNLHIQILESLGKEAFSEWVESFYSTSPEPEKELQKIFEEHNIIQAVKGTRVGGEIGLLSWRWLCGVDLKGNELQKAKVTAGLGELGSGEMVNVLVKMGKLAEKNNEKLIFLIDEGEQFKNVRNSDSIESIHNYIRKLAEPSNSTVGFIIASHSMNPDDMAELLTRADVRTRIGENNFIDIPSLPTINDVESFVKELLNELIDKNIVSNRYSEEALQSDGVELETYPFTKEALEQFCEFASQDFSKSLPRNIIRAINDCAIQTFEAKKQFVDIDTVNEVAPNIFS